MKIIDLLILCIILIIFVPWITAYGTFSAGDWPYLFLENIKEFSWIPNLRFLWLAPYYQILTKVLVEYLGFSWTIVERVFWFWPFIVLSVISSFVLTRSMIGALIYTINTYSLMLVGGGQLGVAMAYSLAPLVLKSFITCIDNLFFISKKAKYLFYAGLFLSIQIMFDPRVAMITLGAALLYGLFSKKNTSLFWLVIPIAGAALLHLYWMVPFLFGNQAFTPHLGQATQAAVKYLSFASLSQTLSLLHPNWPENIFGKVYFFQPEFLILPILAFASLCFIYKLSDQNKKYVLFFALTALIGIFLAKGANEPFGFVYLWIFEHVPGFIIYRDPTKFYLLIALSYSVLIPFTLQRCIELLKHRSLKSDLLIYLPPSAFLIFLLIAHREAVMGQLGGTFRPHPVPYEYVRLKDYLNNKQGFSRVLWVPVRQRYGFQSELRPGLSIDDFGIASISSFLGWIRDPETERELKRNDVTDIVVPTDPLGEIFVTDRMYDDSKRISVVSALRADSDIKEILGFGNIAVFQMKYNYGNESH